MRQSDATGFMLSLEKLLELAENETACNSVRFYGDGRPLRQLPSEDLVKIGPTPQRTRLRFCACRHRRHGRPGITSHPSAFEWGPPTATRHRWPRGAQDRPVRASGSVAPLGPASRLPYACRGIGCGIPDQGGYTPRARWKRFRGGQVGTPHQFPVSDPIGLASLANPISKKF